MSKTSYAKAMEIASKKRSKYEERLENARRVGDRFSINSAERALDRISRYEETLYQTQEETKAAKEQKKYGGSVKPMYADGGPTRAQQVALWNQYNQNKAYYDQQFLANNPFGPQAQNYLNMYNTGSSDLNYGGQNPGLSETFYNTMSSIPAPSNYVPIPSIREWNTAGSATLGFAPEIPGMPIPQVAAAPAPAAPAPKTSTSKSSAPRKREQQELIQLQPKAINPFVTPSAAPSLAPTPQFNMDPAIAAEMQAMQSGQANQNLPFSQTKLGKGFAAAGELAPYAMQFASDIYKLNQLKNLKPNVALPMQQATIINTDIDTSAARAQIQDNTKAFAAGVDQSLSNSAAVANVKLADQAQRNRQLAELSMSERGQETALRNQQADYLTQNINTNAAIAAQNAQNLVDFENMITSARSGMVGDMGTKFSAITSELARKQMDQMTLATMAKQFDKGMLLRNFADVGFVKQFKNEIYQNQQYQDMIRESHILNPNAKTEMKSTDPEMFAFLYPNG